MQDPDFNYTRYHTVVFVQTDADDGGYIHHVTGDLVTGMQYQATQLVRRDVDLENDRGYCNASLAAQIHLRQAELSCHVCGFPI
jgi:hypothetical protein